MGFFGRKQDKPAKQKNLGWGRATVEVIYTGDARDCLLATIDATAEVFGTAIGSRLADELVPGKFRGPRTAINSLRREGVAAIPAIAAIAAWVRSTIDKIPDDSGGYGVREGLLTLSDLRQIILSQAPSADTEVRAALRVFAGFLDGEVEEVARALLKMEYGRAARGAIAYLRNSRGDLQASLEAIEAYLDDHPGETGDGDYDYGRNDAMYTMQELASRIRANALKSESDMSEAPPVAEIAPHIANVELPSADDDDDDDDDDNDRYPDPSHNAANPGRGGAADSSSIRENIREEARIEARELLRSAARDDPDPSVRISALDNLWIHPGDSELVLELARTCLDSDDPGVRTATVRLLGRLAQA